MRRLLIGRFRHQFVRLQQNLFVVRQPRQQPIRAVPRIHLMPFRERLGVMLQLSDAEHLGSQRQVVAEFAKQAVDADARLQPLKSLTDCLTS